MHEGSRLVELVGPAGAGKTTLAQALAAAGDATLVGLPKIKHLGSFPFFATRAIALLPTLFRMLALERAAAGRAAIATMMALQGPPGATVPARPQAIRLFDQGPVFKLAELGGLGGGGIKGSTAERWLRERSDAWLRHLALVLWLDAPDEVLVPRILDRDKDHPVKAVSKSDAIRYLNRYRSACRAVLDVLPESSGGPRVVPLDTGGLSASQVLERARDALQA